MNRWLTDYLLPWHLLRVQSCCSVQPHATLSTRSRPGRFKGKARGDKICFRFQQVFTYIYIYINKICSCNKHISNSRRENYKDVHLLSRAVLQLRLMTFVKSKKQNRWASKASGLKKERWLNELGPMFWCYICWSSTCGSPEISSPTLFSYQCQGEDSIHHTNSCM